VEGADLEVEEADLEVEADRSSVPQRRGQIWRWRRQIWTQRERIKRGSLKEVHQRGGGMGREGEAYHSEEELRSKEEGGVVELGQCRRREESHSLRGVER
jgi:hypothetical protein